MGITRDTFDPKQVNVSCTACGAMAVWCETCKRFKCNRCKGEFTYDIKGRKAVSAKTKKGCNC